LLGEKKREGVRGFFRMEDLRNLKKELSGNLEETDLNLLGNDREEILGGKDRGGKKWGNPGPGVT